MITEQDIITKTKGLIAISLMGRNPIMAFIEIMTYIQQLAKMIMEYEGLENTDARDILGSWLLDDLILEIRRAYEEDYIDKSIVAQVIKDTKELLSTMSLEGEFATNKANNFIDRLEQLVDSNDPSAFDDFIEGLDL